MSCGTSTLCVEYRGDGSPYSEPAVSYYVWWIIIVITLLLLIGGIYGKDGK